MVISLIVGGCGQSAADQVRVKVQEFARAAATRNYGAICTQILAPSLVDHLVSNGIPCQDGLQAALGSVRDPAISVGEVSVRRNKAWAAILASAQGQRALVSAIELQNTPAGWRIVSLDSPLTAVGGGSQQGGSTGTSTTP